MRRPSRRRFLHMGFQQAAVFGAAGAWAARPLQAENRANDQGLSLGFSLYGMKGLKTEDALRMLAQIGYDSAELCLMPAWDAAPERMNAARRKSVREVLEGEGLALPALMEHISLTGGGNEQQAAQQKLAQAAALAHDLKPETPPLIETTAGNGNWNALRNQLRDNLGGWAKVAEATRTVVAVKPHRGGVLDHPDQGVWLVEQINSPWIKLNYDYSHFAHRDISLEGSLRTMLPHTRFIHVKDTIIQNGRARFVLPGESGQIDYAQLLQLAHRFGYRGDICCEVSGMVFGQKGYDAQVAAQTCYKNLTAAFAKSGVARKRS